MADNTMIVTYTAAQLKELIAESVSECLNNAGISKLVQKKTDGAKEISRLNHLIETYGISLSTAHKWKKAMEEDGIIRKFNGRWWVSKADVDDWLLNANKLKSKCCDG